MISVQSCSLRWCERSEIVWSDMGAISFEDISKSTPL